MNEAIHLTASFYSDKLDQVKSLLWRTPIR